MVVMKFKCIKTKKEGSFDIWNYGKTYNGEYSKYDNSWWIKTNQSSSRIFPGKDYLIPINDFRFIQIDNILSIE